MRPTQASQRSAAPANVVAGRQQQHQQQEEEQPSQQQSQQLQRQRLQRRGSADGRMIGTLLSPPGRDIDTISINRHAGVSSVELTTPQLSYVSAREDMHNRPRLVAKTRPLILAAPILDRPKWLHTFFDPCFCFRDNYVEIHSRETSDGSERMGPPHMSAVQSSSSSEANCTSPLGHFLWRFFCVRCSIAEQTHLLFREEEKRGHMPYRFCCEDFYGSEGNMPRTFWTTCLCDIVTLGCPFGCCYHGLGTALYGCRLRYLLRCRYRLNGTLVGDFCRVLCCPLFAVEQQGFEMRQSGLYESRQLGRIML
ncbi:uncharacterized protein TM35_000201540 [Trypanosoma theileri]|uniref:PLAC8 family protein n=1 Tax=Trypanosoma theileri TaxID=67003 RepID=A0A1X0NSP7_9TRYP|nr:uncharacterized protein TM35_000201540 [Trypanosoma theileri]ORC87745.1 hypothetical protein TM35_000201540 [Trypanosoma theileri]